MSTQTVTRTRQPKGVPVGGQFATDAHGEADGVTLVADTPETVFTKRYDTLDEKVEAFHAELEDRVADLADDANWQAYLGIMSKFHRYSGGGALVYELRECRCRQGARGFRRPTHSGSAPSTMEPSKATRTTGGAEVRSHPRRPLTEGRRAATSGLGQ